MINRQQKNPASDFRRLLPALALADPRLLPPHLRKLFYLLVAAIAMVGLSCYALTYSFLPVDKPVTIDGKTNTGVKLYQRRCDGDLLIIEPQPLGAGKYIVYRVRPNDPQSTQVVEADNGLLSVFNGACYVTFYLDPNNLAAMDTDDDNTLHIANSSNQNAFQDEQGHKVSGY